MRKTQKQRGITLIALVITIVVMLILAGVTINLTLGENGIFTTAQKAAQNYTDEQNQELAQLSDFTDGLTAGKVARTEDGVQYVGDGVGNLIPVPVGFSYLEGTKATGFVIKNDTDDNEFVWIPVGSVENYKRVAWSRDGWDYSQTLDEATGKITRDDKDAETYYFTEEMPIDEKDSVSTYGGFYIGRYEAGVKDYNTENVLTTPDGTTTWTGYTGDNIKLVVQKGQQVWNYITRDKAKEVAKELYNKEENNVISKLCSGYAWDSALKFIEKQNKVYPTDSTGGNYTVAAGKGGLEKTGYYAVNNIYDMGGNTREWTSENYGNNGEPCGRDGSYYYGDGARNRPAAYRFGSYNTTAIDTFSYRIAIFI